MSEITQDDLDFRAYCADVTEMRLGAILTTLQGERGVMLGLLRELLEVVTTIQPEGEDERLRLWALEIKTEQLLTMAATAG